METESLDVLHGGRVNNKFTRDTESHHDVVDTALEYTQTVGILLLISKQTVESRQLIGVLLLAIHS
jgi:hypothetical protein